MPPRRPEKPFYMINGRPGVSSPRFPESEYDTSSQPRSVKTKRKDSMLSSIAHSECNLPISRSQNGELRLNVNEIVRRSAYEKQSASAMDLSYPVQQTPGKQCVSFETLGHRRNEDERKQSDDTDSFFTHRVDPTASGYAGDQSNLDSNSVAVTHCERRERNPLRSNDIQKVEDQFGSPGSLCSLGFRRHAPTSNIPSVGGKCIKYTIKKEN